MIISNVCRFSLCQKSGLEVVVVEGTRDQDDFFFHFQFVERLVLIPASHYCLLQLGWCLLWEVNLTVNFSRITVINRSLRGVETNPCNCSV